MKETSQAIAAVNGVFRWPRNETEARLLTEQEIRCLLEGFFHGVQNLLGTERNFLAVAFTDDHEGGLSFTADI